MTGTAAHTPLEVLASTVHDPQRPADQSRARAAVCALHFVGCAVAGRDLPWSASARRVANAEDAAAATVIGLAQLKSVRAALFANAVQGQSTLAEDVHTPSLVHPGSIVIPAALAAAEALDADGSTLLDGIVSGYEVACGLGEALKTPAFVERGFRPSGVFGVFGAAAASARIFGLDSRQTVFALGIAANMAAGLREWARAGTSDVYVQNGMAAANGYFAVILAREGFTGPASALDGDAGMGQAFSGGEADWDRMAQRLQATRAVSEVVFKRFPACSAVQSVLQLAQSMAGLVPVEEIDTVTVVTHHHGKYNPGCDSTGPWTDIGQAQMSNQLGVALALSGARMTIADYARGAQDPQVQAFAKRITVVEDAELTRVYPGRSAARLVIRARGGHTVEDQVDDGSPLSDAEAVEFASAALQAGFGAGTGSMLAGQLETVATARSVRQLTAAIRAARPAAAQFQINTSEGAAKPC